MPVYLRKNMAFTPPSLADGPDDNSLQEGDFITDPEQMRDNLPQPFRMIDKIIQKLVDEVSETIVSREEERLKDATRPRAPQYQCGLRIEVDESIYSSIFNSVFLHCKRQVQQIFMHFFF